VRNVFSPIFLTSLLLLPVFHYLDITNYRAVYSFVITTFLLAAGLYGLKKFKLSYVFITLAVGLLITARFLEEKETFYRVSESSVAVVQDQYISMEGKLLTFPEIKKDHSVLYLETEYLEYNRKKIFKSLIIRIKVKGNLKNLFRGDTVAIDAKIYTPTFNKNFYANPFENYLLVRKNHFNGYCKSARMVTVVKKTGLFWRLIGTWRNKIREVIEHKYGSPAGGSTPGIKLDKKGVFLQAILIGDRGKLTNIQKDQLISSGVYHLLAISGAHIGIIALLSLTVLRFLKVSSRKRYIVTALVLIVFLVLSGFKISAERAVLMAILIFIARILYLDINIYNIISLCGLFILARNPAEFLDAGFILTFTLTAAIVMGRKIFLPLLNDIKASARGAIRSFCGVQGRFFQKEPLPAGGNKNFISELLSANFSAALIALPLSLFFFKRYSFAGFFSGLLLVPITALVIGFGFLLIPLAPLSSYLANIVLIIVDIPLFVFFQITGFFSEIVDMSIFRASPSIFSVLIILTAFFLLSLSQSKFQKITLSFIVFLVTLFISVNVFFYTPKNLEVFYLDVGQGDCQLVVFPGGDGLLIDGGGAYYSNFQVGRQIVLPFLLQKKIKVKWVAVSHFHPDHANGIAEIIDIIKPEELWFSSEAAGESSYKKLMQSIDESIRVKKLTSSFIKKIGRCTLEFLYPDRFIRVKYSHNNHSQVIRISDGQHSFLFTGDIEKETEGYLVENSCSALRASVIKVPHHGSVSSSTREFLRCVSPRLAIFSYALNNRFRFPHKQVVKNYKNQKIRFLSTARSGGIKLVSLPGGIQIETSK